MYGTACITIFRHMVLRWTSKYAKLIYSNYRILPKLLFWLLGNLLYSPRNSVAFYFASIPAINLIRRDCALAIDRHVNSDRRSIRQRLISLQSSLCYERSVFLFFSYSDSRFYSYNYDRDRINHASENLRGVSVSFLSAGGCSLFFFLDLHCMTYKHYTSECDTAIVYMYDHAT